MAATTAQTTTPAIPKVTTKASAKEKLDALRAHMQLHRLQAYYIPSEDAHQSEYIAPGDGRRHFLTNFTGSAGFAIVLAAAGGNGGGGDGEKVKERAALWTDGRYFNQAEHQLDGQWWTLMRAGLPETPKREEWLCKKLSPNDRVGIDPKLISGEAAKKLQEQLGKIELVAVEENLVDAIWADRPKNELRPVKSLPVEFSGRSVSDKLQWLRKEHLKTVKAILLSQLDEIAWLFNLRGSDIPFNPVFFSYAIVTENTAVLYVDDAQRLPLETLQANSVTVKPYGAVFDDIKTLADVQVGTTCNWALIKSAAKPPVVKTSPIELEKAVKNETELAGFRKCHIYDAAAVCKYFAWLQDELRDGKQVNECEGADKLEQFRRECQECTGLSFDTISGSGPNGAVIHYKPEPATCAAITRDQMYLLDSGGQYLSGTTDITRTVHFGQPSEYQRRCFTAVLKGVISLATAVFPRGTKGIQLDAMARQHLWKLGLDYRHGTGHGVGHYLNVHEGPHSISPRSGPEDADLRPGMTVTDEPGYYEDGKFGIRIENVLLVVERKTEFAFCKCFGFETITLVPIQSSLIDVGMLTAGEIAWIDAYHQECWDKVSGLLEGRAKEWLFDNTRPLH